MNNAIYYIKEIKFKITLIEPTILEEKTFKLLGCVFYGDPFHSAEEWSYENEIGKLWQRFGALTYKYSILMNKISIEIILVETFLGIEKVL